MMDEMDKILDVREYGCGCRAHIAHIEHCALHKAATGMKALLERFGARDEWTQITPYEMDAINDLLATIKGRA